MIKFKINIQPAGFKDNRIIWQMSRWWGDFKLFLFGLAPLNYNDCFGEIVSRWRLKLVDCLCNNKLMSWCQLIQIFDDEKIVLVIMIVGQGQLIQI